MEILFRVKCTITPIIISKNPNIKILTDKFPNIKPDVIIPKTGIIGIFPMLIGTLKPLSIGFLILKYIRVAFITIKTVNSKRH